MLTPVVTALAPLASVTDSLKTLVVDHGLLAVFVLMTLESCGIPIPSEVTMPVAGAAAAGAFGDHGSLTILSATLAGTVGNLAGSVLAWLIAARWGEPVLLGPGRYVGISRSHVELADRLFRRYGLVLVLVGRVLPVVRTYISFPAGMARVDLVRFSVLTFVGALPWCFALTLAGYEVGTNYDNVARPVQIAGYVIAVAVVAFVVGWFVRGRRVAARDAAAAPRACAHARVQGAAHAARSQAGAPRCCADGSDDSRAEWRPDASPHPAGPARHRRRRARQAIRHPHRRRPALLRGAGR